MFPLEFHHDLTSFDVLSLLALFASVGVLAIAVYRLHFHPLSRYPGPFWARISSFPSYWHTLRQDRHIWLCRLQEEYGKWPSTPLPTQFSEYAMAETELQAQHFDTGLTASSSTPPRPMPRSSGQRAM